MVCVGSVSRPGVWVLPSDNPAARRQRPPVADEREPPHEQAHPSCGQQRRALRRFVATDRPVAVRTDPCPSHLRGARLRAAAREPQGRHVAAGAALAQMAACGRRRESVARRQSQRGATGQHRVPRRDRSSRFRCDLLHRRSRGDVGLPGRCGAAAAHRRREAGAFRQFPDLHVPILAGRIASGHLPRRDCPLSPEVDSPSDLDRLPVEWPTARALRSPRSATPHGAPAARYSARRTSSRASRSRRRGRS
ncbi:hypothetical protein LMG29660_03521 [Burkholderia puraquae]|uniref:Uncharacterized protein n=1 Tax=Burkholderia puraquae TaxID=1904757 RepID=A0A6J5DXM1_9BURK|nr:hypothetical protein LMG29660_03521 [Burkholderia puraquae]